MAIGKRKIDRIDSRVDTYKHIQTVQKYLGKCIHDLLNRQMNHDQSKLVEPELSIFDEFTPKLRECAYDSKEYKENLKNMEVGLNHHYQVNDHHPQHEKPIDDPDYERLRKSRDDIEFGSNFGEWATNAVEIMDKDLVSRRSSIRSMNLLSIIEMLMDWQASCSRSPDGDIYKSIEINQRRFGYTDELKNILINTVKYLEKQK